MVIKLANNASALLPGPILATDTVITLRPGDGGLFPALSTGDYFYATLAAPTGASEIVKVVARQSDVLAITRAQAGTTALAVSSGALLELRNNKENVEDFVRFSVQNAVGTTTLSDATVIERPVNSTYTFLNSGWNGSINTVATKTVSGTCTVTVTINGTPLGGSPNAASSTKQEQSHTTSNIVAEGDDIAFVVSDAADPTFLSVSITGPVNIV